MTVKSAYNFVPLTKMHDGYVKPEWSYLVSHDVPFKKGLSGSFKIKIVAESPIFIGNSKSRADLERDKAERKQISAEGNDDKATHHISVVASHNSPHGTKEAMSKTSDSKSTERFCMDDNGTFFIPGSSIKGAIRNVLEIMSFGNIRNNTEDRSFAFRDLNNKDGDLYRNKFINRVGGGWLKNNLDGTYELSICEKIGRIGHDGIDKLLGLTEKVSLHELYQKGESKKHEYKQNQDKDKSAKAKYLLLGVIEKSNINGKDERVKWEKISFKADELLGKLNDPKYYKFCDFKGDEMVTLVLTGQPGKKRQEKNKKGKLIWKGKHWEFLFGRPTDHRLCKTFKENERIITAFFEANKDSDRNQWSEDWKFWRKELEAGREIPVFFIKDDNGEPKFMGLSYLFKLPFEHSVHDVLGNYDGNAPDLAETIFGYTRKDGDSLKGRVHFSHAIANEAEEYDSELSLILSSPKPSFYPYYIEQKANANGYVTKYKTLMDGDARLAGWKRYPVHSPFSAISSNVTNQDLVTTIKPLKAGAEFEGVVQYHNLLPEELGALISAIQFHGCEEARHNLGMGKPYGLGKVKIELSDLDGDEAGHMSEFEAYMESKLSDPGWLKSDQMRELICMAIGQRAGSPKLEYYEKPKDFADEVKKKNKPLPSFSKLCNNLTSELLDGLRKSSEDQRSNKKSQIEKWRVDEEAVSGKNLKEVINELLEQKHSYFKETIQERLAQLKQEYEAISKAKQVEASEERLSNAPDELKEELKELLKEDLKARSFEKLKKMIKKYQNSVLKAIKAGVATEKDSEIPDEARDLIVDILKKIENNLGKKDRKKWADPTRGAPIRGAIASWIGKDLAQVSFSFFPKE